MKKDSLNLLEGLITLIMLAIGIFVIFHANSLPLFGPRSLSPGLFPLLSGIAICLCAVTLLIMQLRIFLRSKRFHLPEKQQEDRGIILPIILLFVYVAALPKFHFIPTTIIFLIIMMGIFRKKVTISIATVSIVTVLVIYLLFSKVLMISLP